MSDLRTSAAAFARKAHDGQKRKYSGQPYFVHPSRVADRIHDITHDMDMNAAAYLHDVVEDCGVTVAELSILFGPRVARLVEDVTNIHDDDELREDKKRADRNRLHGATIEAQTIKLADRLDNVLELSRDMFKAEAARKFAPVYLRESVLLLAAIGHANEVLAEDLFNALADLREAINRSRPC